MLLPRTLCWVGEIIILDFSEMKRPHGATLPIRCNLWPWPCAREVPRVTTTAAAQRSEARSLLPRAREFR